MYVVAVIAIGVHVLNGDTELSQRTTEPVLPVKVNKPLVLPKQIVVPPLTVPATVAGFTVTVVVAEFALVQLPL